MGVLSLVLWFVLDLAGGNIHDELGAVPISANDTASLLGEV